MHVAASLKLLLVQLALLTQALLHQLFHVLHGYKLNTCLSS